MLMLCPNVISRMWCLEILLLQNNCILGIIRLISAAEAITQLSIVNLKIFPSQILIFEIRHRVHLPFSLLSHLSSHYVSQEINASETTKTVPNYRQTIESEFLFEATISTGRSSRETVFIPAFL